MYVNIYLNKSCMPVFYNTSRAVTSGGTAPHEGLLPHHENFKIRQQAVTKKGRGNAPSPHNKSLLPPLHQPWNFLRILINSLLLLWNSVKAWQAKFSWDVQWTWEERVKGTQNPFVGWGTRKHNHLGACKCIFKLITIPLMEIRQLKQISLERG